jgi:hypothetical protein
MGLDNDTRGWIMAVVSGIGMPGIITRIPSIGLWLISMQRVQWVVRLRQSVTAVFMT